MIDVDAGIPGLITALGGNSAVAAHLGVAPSTVSEFKRRGNIPVRYWPEIISFAVSKGKNEVNADLMMRVHEIAPEVAAE